MKLYDELRERELIDNITSRDLIDKLNSGGLTFYIGVDPTGESLHIGHYCSAITTVKRLMDAGHNPIIIAGGGTGLIGDPKLTSERPMIAKEAVIKNIDSIKKQIDQLLKGNIKIVNNADWLLQMGAVDYLRDFGKFFNVNYMINKDTVKSRLDIGITYTEFSYMILQSIDFLKLYENYNCTLQIGGSDQWGNITSGLELIRKVHGDQVECYGLTMPLILKADGTKFGKTASGESVWLDSSKTSPYEMYQFLLNTSDSVVISYLKKLTFLTLEEIKRLADSLAINPEQREAQKKLAEEVVTFVHGKEEALKAIETSEKIFNEGSIDHMPSLKMSLEEDINILDLLVRVNISPSRSEARRNVEQGGITINDDKITDFNKMITKKDFDNNYIVIKKGKKTFLKVELDK